MTVHAYSGYRFPADMIQRAIWMYLRFTFSYRDVEELLAARQRGILRDCSTGTVKLLMEGALSLAQVWILGGPCGAGHLGPDLKGVSSGPAMAGGAGGCRTAEQVCYLMMD